MNSQVFSGAGITIPADQSETGKATVINPATGDTTSKDITVEIMKNNDEQFFKSQPVQ